MSTASKDIGYDTMKAVKVYNNNAVATICSDEREAILIGSGIGYHKRPGDLIDEKKIEKIYYIQDDLQTRFLQLLKNARPEALKASEEILAYAREQGLELKNQLILSLTDHISFALERAEQGIELPYLMLSETRMLYQKEYEIGRWALKKIKELCSVELPKYEAGYIALQLASSVMNPDVAYNTLKLAYGALDIIKDTYGVELNPDDIDTMRLTTHLKFLAQRIFCQIQWNDDDMDGLYQLLIRRHRKNRECIGRLSDFIRNNFSYELNHQEKVYLMVHLSKIFNN